MEQFVKKQRAVMYEYNGERKTLKDWEKFSGINRHVIYQRIKRGESMKSALDIPAKQYDTSKSYIKKTLVKPQRIIDEFNVFDINIYKLDDFDQDDSSARLNALQRATRMIYRKQTHNTPTK